MTTLKQLWKEIMLLRGGAWLRRLFAVRRVAQSFEPTIPTEAEWAELGQVHNGDEPLENGSAARREGG